MSQPKYRVAMIYPYPRLRKDDDPEGADWGIGFSGNGPDGERIITSVHDILNAWAAAGWSLNALVPGVVDWRSGMTGAPGEPPPPVEARTLNLHYHLAVFEKTS